MLLTIYQINKFLRGESLCEQQLFILQEFGKESDDQDGFGDGRKKRF